MPTSLFPFASPAFRTPFLALVIVDLLFILWFAIHGVTWWLGLHQVGLGRMSLAEDWHLPEVFNYLKWFGFAGVMALLWRSTGQRIYLAFGAVGAMLFLDDAAQMHERLGALIAQALGIQPRFGLRAIDLGELLVLVLMGLLVIALILQGLRKADAAARRDAWWLFRAVAALAFCGVVFDLLHVLAENAAPDGLRGRLGFGAIILEEGSEMIATSLILATAILAWRLRRSTAAQQG